MENAIWRLAFTFCTQTRLRVPGMGNRAKGWVLTVVVSVLLWVLIVWVVPSIWHAFNG